MAKYLVLPYVNSRLVGEYGNGKIPLDELTEIRGRGWLTPHAARSWVVMATAMLIATGIDLTWTGNMYRTYAQQRWLFESRYEACSYAQYLYARARRRGKTWPAARTYGHSSIYFRKRRMANGRYPATAATPGTSNHGKAQAVDAAQDGFGSAVESLSWRALDWLKDNAASYGWSWELQSEPWHLRYLLGDAVNSKVLAAEGWPIPTPTPDHITVEDEDMHYLTNPVREYDTRQASGYAGAGRPFAAGETRTVAIAFATVAHFNVTVKTADGQQGFVTVSGIDAESASSVVNFDADGIANAAIPLGIPDGHARITASAACDIIIDVFALGTAA